jgi:hypothetical protein
VSVQEVLDGKTLWAVAQWDCLKFLASLPPDSVSLIFGSPPYSTARAYLERGEDLGIARETEDWVQWMRAVVLACLRVCTGLVAFVVEDRTDDFSYGGGPLLLAADLLRAGVTMRKPAIYRRVGIPGSGGKDWLRNDWEWILTFTRGGKLPWADPKAMGHPPKWGPGGEMSYRNSAGTRRNAWGRNGTSDNGRDRKGDRKRGTPPSAPLPPRAGAAEPGLFGPVEVLQPPEMVKTGAVSGYRNGDTAQEGTYRPPAIANPGNCVQHLYTAQEVADVLGETSDIVDCTAGGGQMGSKLCHDNEAPFPERLPEFFIRSFCPPGGVCLDPFVGSGTTGAVAVRWGRRFLGCDVRPSQVTLARQRIAGETPSLFEGASVNHDR